MTAATTRPHVAALRDLLTAAQLTVLDGGVGEPVPPCVVWWPQPGTPAAGSVGVPDSDLIVEVTTVACGTTVEQALWVADRIIGAMNRAKPGMSGRTVHPVLLVDVTSVRRDDSLAAPMHSAALRWRLMTTPL